MALEYLKVVLVTFSVAILVKKKRKKEKISVNKQILFSYRFEDGCCQALDLSCGNTVMQSHLLITPI